MCTTTAGPLEFYNACYCAGTGCGGHVVFRRLPIQWTPIGYQGAAQHTYTMACDGFHEPGQCPKSEQPYTVHI
jgi:hypothetical protein